MHPRDCSIQIAASLRDLGVLPGANVLVHSGFKSLGFVPGGIETVIEGLLQAIGPEGTLLMPALRWALEPPGIFNARLTPVQVGAIPEYFRLREGTLRSIHPTHSVCAVGERRHAFLDAHRLDCTPCGLHSPFRKLLETSGKIVMLGCGLSANTTMHALEEYVPPPYLFGRSVVYTITDQHNHTYRKEYRTHGFTSNGYRQRYDRVLELEDVGSFLARGKVLQATTFVMDAPQLKSAVLKKLQKVPFFFVDAEDNLATGGDGL